MFQFGSKTIFAFTLASSKPASQPAHKCCAPGHYPRQKHTHAHQLILQLQAGDIKGSSCVSMCVQVLTNSSHSLTVTHQLTLHSKQASKAVGVIKHCKSKQQFLYKNYATEQEQQQNGQTTYRKEKWTEQLRNKQTEH